jgi:DNA repair photolyase
MVKFDIDAQQAAKDALAGNSLRPAMQIAEHDSDESAVTATALAPASVLFPILQGEIAPRLTGMARLAAESTHADDGHLIEFKAMRARSILNKSQSKRRLSLAYSINPFRGCEFGCKYCYARYTHEFLEPKSSNTSGNQSMPLSAHGNLSQAATNVIPIVRANSSAANDLPQQSWALDFERTIYLKENAAWLLEQEIRKIDPADEIAIGTATDPYQPIERRVGITRSILEVFAKLSGYRIGLITKSTLITRDIDLLQQIAARNTLVLHVTITTTDAALARQLEPRAPRPDLRFAAVRKLREAGLTAGVLCSPLLPGINDSLQQLEAVSSRAAAAGASFLGAHPLFLKSCSRPTWMSFVREYLPHLAADYERRYSAADFIDATYRNRMASLVRQLCRRYGLAERSTDALLTREVDLPRSAQQPAAASVPERKQPRRATASAAEPQQPLLFAC